MSEQQSVRGRRTQSQRKSDLRSLSEDEAAELLGLPVDTVRAHIARGLPLRKDGRVDLVAYAAWLNTEEAKVRGDDAGA